MIRDFEYFEDYRINFGFCADFYSYRLKCLVKDYLEVVFINYTEDRDIYYCIAIPERKGLDPIYFVFNDRDDSFMFFDELDDLLGYEEGFFKLLFYIIRNGNRLGIEMGCEFNETIWVEYGYRFYLRDVSF